MAAERRDLPGWPKKRLVKQVRSHLWRYGIRPQWRPWRATWSWAHAIAISYYHTRWPSASEISTQYILLLLVEMKANFSLRLPYRASKVVPDEVKAMMLPGNPVPLLIHEPVLDGEKSKNADAADGLSRHPLDPRSDFTPKRKDQDVQSQNDIRSSITSTIIDALKNGGLLPVPEIVDGIHSDR